MDILLEASSTDKVHVILQKVVDRIFGERHSCESETLQKDLIFVLILTLLNENEFKVINEKDELTLETIDTETFSKFKLHGKYEVRTIVSNFKLLPLKLIMSPLGSTVILNIIIEELNKETYSVCLPISRYVVSPQASTVPKIYRELKNFTILVKNNIIAPVKSRVLSYFGYPSASLMGLPDEILLKIVIQLSINDVTNLSKTCMKINSALENASFWHELHKRDFGVSTGPEDKSWKELYIQCYQLKQNKSQTNQRQRLAGTMHDFMDYSDYVSYIDNPLWDVI